MNLRETNSSERFVYVTIVHFLKVLLVKSETIFIAYYFR